MDRSSRSSAGEQVKDPTRANTNRKNATSTGSSSQSSTEEEVCASRSRRNLNGNWRQKPAIEEPDGEEQSSPGSVSVVYTYLPQMRPETDMLQKSRYNRASTSSETSEPGSSRSRGSLDGPASTAGGLKLGESAGPHHYEHKTTKDGPIEQTKSKNEPVNPETVRPGQVVYLPRQSMFLTDCEDIPPKAFDHPAVISELLGDTAIVFIITSFGGGGGFPKYKSDIREEDYLPVKPAKPHYQGGPSFQYLACDKTDRPSCLAASNKQGWIGIHQPVRVALKNLRAFYPHTESFSPDDMTAVRRASRLHLSGDGEGSADTLSSNRVFNRDLSAMRANRADRQRSAPSDSAKDP